MTPLEQSALPLTRIVDPVDGRHAPWALWMLDHAVEAYRGDASTQRVSTTTQWDDVSSNVCLVVAFEDGEHDVHATVVVDESTYIALVPLPRTSRDQTIWVRDMLRRVLDAPEGRALDRPEDVDRILDAYAIIDREGAAQTAHMEIHHMAATPLGTGGTHVCFLDDRRSLSDRTSAMPGAVEVVVTHRERQMGVGSTTVIRLEAHCHTTSVPAADTVERLRIMHDIASRKAMAA